MQKEYYECHVTFNLPTTSHGRPPISGWKFSAIDGDPVLGAGVKCYLTRQFKASRELADVIDDLEGVASELRRNGIEVLRTKVELVVYDSKSLPEKLFK